MHSSSLFQPLLAAETQEIIQKSSGVTFFWGALLIFLLFYYLGTADHWRKKVVGTLLTVLISAFCIWAINGWNVFLGKPINIKLGMDLAGGSEFTAELKPGVGDDGKEKPVTPEAVQQVIGTIEKRLNPEGTKDLLIAPQGEKRILIQMPGVSLEDVEGTKKILEQTAQLDFRMAHPDGFRKLAEMEATGKPVFGYVKMPAKKPQKDKNDPKAAEPDPGPEHYLVKDTPDLSGKHVTNAWVTQDAGNRFIINLKFDSEGGEKFYNLTKAHVNQPLAIVVDGEVISAPNIDEPIDGGNCIIKGRFKLKEALTLATALENPLDNPMEIVASNYVSPQFGAQTIQQGIYTGIAGLIMTALFSVLYYRFAGLIALVGLFVNLLMVFGAMSLFNFTLTMPGIAGIVLSVGMAVDANVLIYERLREEMRAGKSLTTALEAAFEKAFSAIFDANITTLMSAIILFYLGSGLIKGFAITLTVGIIGSLLGALIVTRVIFHWFTDANILKKITVTEIIPNRIFNALGMARPFIIGSFILMVASILIFPVKGWNSIGIDFRGGTLTRFDVAANATVDAHDVEKVLLDAGVSGAYVQENTTGTGKLISVRSETTDAAKVNTTLKEKYGDKLKDGQSESVGSVVGKQLAWKSTLAFLAAMLAIFIYLVIFYEISFAVGAIIALLHDCIITIGLAVILGQQLSIIHISALLTVAGYSINDTIVVFDRIREIIKSRSGDIRDIMNEAISLTLSRTLLTGVTTLGPMAALYFFGGPAMKDLALPIIIGVLVGTYSSIYIASPIVLWWAKFTGKSLRRQVLDTEAEKIKPIVTA